MPKRTLAWLKAANAGQVALNDDTRPHGLSTRSMCASLKDAESGP